jgi:hypothetical protein
VTRVKPAEVRFYLDADILGLAHVLAHLRADVTYPGDPGAVIQKRERPPCPIANTATPDHEWIREVAARGWLIVTRDKRIQDHRAEITAVRRSGARMVALSSDDARSTFGQLEVVMCRWRDLERCMTEPGPFIYTATRTSFRRVPIDPPDQQGQK